MCTGWVPRPGLRGLGQNPKESRGARGHPTKLLSIHLHWASAPWWSLGVIATGGSLRFLYIYRWVLGFGFTEMIRCFLPFIHIVYHINFHVLDQLCISGINFTWPWCVTLFIHCWIQLADIGLYTFISKCINSIHL